MKAPRRARPYGRPNASRETQMDAANPPTRSVRRQCRRLEHPRIWARHANLALARPATIRHASDPPEYRAERTPQQIPLCVDRTSVCLRIRYLAFRFPDRPKGRYIVLNGVLLVWKRVGAARQSVRPDCLPPPLRTFQPRTERI